MNVNVKLDGTLYIIENNVSMITRYTVTWAYLWFYLIKILELFPFILKMLRLKPSKIRSK